MSELSCRTITLPEHFLEPEERDGFRIERTVKELWAVQLDLMQALVAVCKEYNLTYVPIGGTLLGAIRHNGMIPWDDDLDIALPRKDYDRLCELTRTKKLFRAPYFFQTEKTDPGSLRGHAQLRNSETTCFIRGECGLYRFNQGIFIDIFPLDVMPDKEDERQAFLDECRQARDLAEAFANKTTRLVPWNSGNPIKKFLKYIVRFLAIKLHLLPNRAYAAYERVMQKYADSDYGEIGIVAICLILDKYHWKREWYENCTEHAFEFLTIPVPEHYEEILTRTYGDWHRFVIGTSVHGGLIWDARQSYRTQLTAKERERAINEINDSHSGV